MYTAKKGAKAFILGVMLVLGACGEKDLIDLSTPVDPKTAQPGDHILGGGKVVGVVAPPEGGCFKPIRDPNWPNEAGTEVFIHSMKSDPPVEGWNRYNGHVELVSAALATGPWNHYTLILGSQAKPDPFKGQWSLEIVCERKAFAHQTWDTTTQNNPTVLSVEMKLLIIQGGAPPPAK